MRKKRPRIDRSNHCLIFTTFFFSPVTVYRAVRQSLNTETPSVLVCREKQVGSMRDFLTHHLNSAKPGSLYVSGAPGTGKTASLNSILDSLKVQTVYRCWGKLL